MFDSENGAGILVSSDKFIDRDYAKSVRRYLSMTKVFQILEEEKQVQIHFAYEATGFSKRT